MKKKNGFLLLNIESRIWDSKLKIVAAFTIIFKHNWITFSPIFYSLHSFLLTWRLLCGTYGFLSYEFYSTLYTILPYKLYSNSLIFWVQPQLFLRKLSFFS